MKTKKMRKFAFFMALLMLVTSIDFTSVAAERTAEETVAVESQAADEAMDEAAMVMESEEENALTEDILPEAEWSEEGTLAPNDETKIDIAENEAIPTTDITNIAISEEETIVTTDYGISNPRKDANGYTVWDCVWFGNYWQEDTNGDGKADTSDNKEPIKWRVLSVSGDQALLLADKNLDCKQYNTKEVDVTWETCTLRSWLNGYGAENNVQEISYVSDNFISSAFTVAEKNAIVEKKLVNADNHGIEGGNRTTDRVFLLSLQDTANTSYGFRSYEACVNTARRAANTAFAKSKGAKTSTYEGYAGNGWWWLRSPGHYSDYAALVCYDGYVSGVAYLNHGGTVDSSGIAVRPALYLNLSSTAVWSKAETVTDDPKTTLTPIYSEKYDLSTPSKEANGKTVWDCVWFGNYWQNDTNGDGKADTSDNKEPIKWRVLSVSGDQALLLADKNLDCKQYNTECESVTWETCTLRSWLNGYGDDINDQAISYESDNFISSAFTAAEKNAIAETTLVNADNGDIEGGNDTIDRVFLLSLEETRNTSYGFDWNVRADDTARSAVNTDFTADYEDIYPGNGSWWLRSPGYYGSAHAAYVDNSGNVYSNGDNVDDSDDAVRPALYLNLSSTDVWSKAGTVNEDGPVEEIVPEPTPTPTPTLTPEYSEKYDLSTPSKDTNGNTVWDCVWFGNYWQEDTNGDGKADTSDNKEPIKWRVLSVSGDQALLLADKNLDAVAYNTEDVDIIWETCTLRSWLNGYGDDINDEGISYESDNFIGSAFTASEKNAIAETKLVNEDNAKYGIEGGNDTNDRVFLLSFDDVGNTAYGFNYNRSASALDTARRAANTAFAKSRGARTNTSDEYAGNGYWWLRSPGEDSYFAALVYYNGYVYSDGFNVEESDIAVRPALYLNLSATDVWSKAGTVNADGSMEEIAPIEPAPSHITFDPNGGKITMSENGIVVSENGMAYKIVSYNGTYGKLPTVSYENHDFLGWFTDKEAGEQVTEESKVTSSQTLYAHWKKSDIIITFDSNGGTFSGASLSDKSTKYSEDGTKAYVTVRENDTLLPKPYVKRIGFIFDGWQAEDGQIVSNIEKPEKSCTYKATWIYPNVCVKNKLDITKYLQNYYSIKSYRILVDGIVTKKYGTVSKKGIFTAKKAGKLYIEGLDSNKNVVEGIFIEVHKPYYEKGSTPILTKEKQSIELSQYIKDMPNSHVIEWAAKPRYGSVIDGKFTSGEKSEKVTITAIIISELTGYSVKVKIPVTVKLPKISTKPVTVKCTKQKTLSVTNLVGQNVTWKSSNPSVATASASYKSTTKTAKGVVEGISPGTAIITATVDDVDYNFTVTVE